MKYNHPTKILAAAVLLSVCSLSFAEPGEPGKRMFDRVDADGDGYVSFDEFGSIHEKMGRGGNKADLNGNGEVTREEMQNHLAERQAEMSERATTRFDRMDLNGDGTVTQAEAKEAAFYRMDKDQDGYLSPQELKRPRKGPGRGRAG